MMCCLYSDQQLWLCVFLFSSVVVRALKECKKVDVCKISTDKGLINLWSLAGKGDNIPRFYEISDPEKGGYLYSWNPCNPWSEKTTGSFKNTCHDIAVCLILQNSLHFNIGTQQSTAVSLDTSSGNCVLTFEGSSVGATYTRSVTHISLNCDKKIEGSLKYVKTTVDKSFEVYFSLQSKYACVISSRLSTGSILLIVFFTFLMAYLVGGMLFNKLSKEAKGWELVPNLSFWRDFPFLVKDGLVFAYGFCKRICSKQGYATI